MNEQFQTAEQEYLRLRGMFSTGRITERAFDEALRELTVVDAQGRYWMLGANTGNWYFASGERWIAGNPYQAEPMSPELPAAEEDADAMSARGLALPFLVSGIVLMIVAGVALLVFNFDQISAADSQTLPTRIVPPTTIAVGATPLDATPTRTAVRAATLQTDVTPIPVTVTPAAPAIEPTNTSPVLTTIPTITPGAIFADSSAQGDPFADTSFDVPTPEQPGSLGLAPDVYVTNLRVSPNPPLQQQNITFTASFLNTNAQSVGMEWRVVILNQNKVGQNKDWGESQLVGITIPPGTSEFSLAYTPVTNAGPCITLQALVARRLDDNRRFLLPGIHGTPYATNLTFC